MSSVQSQQEFYLKVGAQKGKIKVLAATVANQAFDLSTFPEIWGAAGEQGQSGIQWGRKIRLTASCDNPAQATNGGVYFALDSVTGTISSLNSVSDTTQADFLAWGQSLVVSLPYVKAATGAVGQGVCKFLMVILAAAGAVAAVNPALRISIAEESPSNR